MKGPIEPFCLESNITEADPSLKIGLEVRSFLLIYEEYISEQIIRIFDKLLSFIKAVAIDRE